MFVAPVLFVIHAALSGLSMVAFNVFSCRAIGPNGFLDFLLYNLPLGIGKTHWPTYIIIGLVFFAVYYVVFRVLITALNLKTLGRESDGMEMKLHTKAEYKEKVASGKGKDKDTVDAALIIEALGGAENLEKVDNCYTRLRLILKNPELVKDDVLKNETGANGVVKKGNNVQVIYGLKVNAVRRAVDAALGSHAES